MHTYSERGTPFHQMQLRGFHNQLGTIKILPLEKKLPKILNNEDVRCTEL